MDGGPVAYSDPETKVLCGVITRSHVHAGTIGSITWAISKGALSSWLIRTHGPYLTNARNSMVRAFLAIEHRDKTHLLFVDSDQRFTPEDVRAVVSRCTRETPVVGGLYVNPDQTNGSHNPIAYSLEPDGFHQLDMGPCRWTHPSEGDPCIEVGAVGTGFMAIHRSLIETMPGTFSEPCPWFAEPVFGDPPKMIGEDLGFCLRVLHLDHPVLLHRGAKIGHFKECLIYPESFDQPILPPEPSEVPPPAP